MPQIEYAGRSLLLEDPGHEFHNWLERSLSLEDLYLFGVEPPTIYQGRHRPRGPFLGDPSPHVGLPLPNYSTRRPPRWKINTLWWPTGATRWGIGLYLIHEAELAEIVKGLDNGRAELRLQHVANGVPGPEIKTQMYLLPPRELNATVAGVNGYLLCLVDARYFWQFCDVGENLVDRDHWEDVYGQLGSCLGTTIDHDSIPDAYAQADPTELTRRHENTAVLLDAVAHSVGQRIVYNFDGSVRAVNVDSAKEAHEDNAKRIAWHMAGGDQQKFRSTLYPSSVSVVFPKYVGAEPVADGQTWEREVSLSEVDEEAPEPIASTSKVIYSTAAAIFRKGELDSSPNNEDDLDALAEQIATDYYGWLAHTYDQTALGLVAWRPSGYDDWIWWHGGYQHPVWLRGEESHGEYTEFTRATSMPAGFGVTEQLSQFDLEEEESEPECPKCFDNLCVSDLEELSSPEEPPKLIGIDGDGCIRLFTTAPCDEDEEPSGDTPVDCPTCFDGLCVSDLSVLRDDDPENKPFVLGVDKDGCIRKIPTGVCPEEEESSSSVSVSESVSGSDDNGVTDTLPCFINSEIGEVRVPERLQVTLDGVRGFGGDPPGFHFCALNGCDGVNGVYVVEDSGVPVSPGGELGCDPGIYVCTEWNFPEVFHTCDMFPLGGLSAYSFIRVGLVIMPDGLRVVAELTEIFDFGVPGSFGANIQYQSTDTVNVDGLPVINITLDVCPPPQPQGGQCDFSDSTMRIESI